MKFKSISKIVLSTILSASMLLSGCATKSADTLAQDTKETEVSKEDTTSTDKNVTLKIYAQYSDEDTKAPFDYAVAALKEAMPHVTLELDIQAQDDGQKLKTYAATGNMPDIFNAGLDLINTMKKSNNIVDLTEYAKEFGYTDKIYDSAKNILYHEDGHIYAFPYAGNEMNLLFVNKELFEANNVKIPETYEELLTAVEQFNAVGVTPLSMFAKEKWPCVSLYDMMVTRYEPKGIKGLDTGETKITDEAYQKAADNIIELVEKGLLPKGATNLNYDQAASLFHTGKAAMFINGQWEIDASTKALGDKVDWIPFPAASADTMEASKYNFSGSGTVGGYAVSPTTKDVRLAAEVAAFISEKVAECKYTQRSNPLIAIKIDKPIEVPYPKMMEKLSETIPNIKTTTAFAWGLGNAKYKTTLEDESQMLLSGGYDSKSFINNVSKSLEK